MQSLIGRRPAGSVEELIAGATHREPLGGTDGKSGAALERVVIGGEPFVLKQLHVDHDWTMRGFGDLCCRPVHLWVTGFLDLVPDCIEHGVVSAATGLGRHGWGAALLMRDVGPSLFPEGDQPISLEDHRQLLGDLARLSAAFWGGVEDHTLGFLDLGTRYTAFNPSWLEVERTRGWPDPVPRIAHDGWQRFAERAPDGVRYGIAELQRDVSPLVDALATTPWTFLHGDWKMGNLGMTPDRRSVLLDWTYPGTGPVLHELCWYLALNRQRLPEPKEAAIEALRVALEAEGIATDGWWEAQRDLCLLGTLLQFGWEKALGDHEELSWWCERAAAGLARL